MKKLAFTPDANSFVFVENASDTGAAVLTGAAQPKTIPIPAGARFVRLKGTDGFFFDTSGAAATVPGADGVSSAKFVQSQSSAEFTVSDLAQISVVGPTGSSGVIVTAEFWA